MVYIPTRPSIVLPSEASPLAPKGKPAQSTGRVISAILKNASIRSSQTESPL
jgi:hypothetical protein